MSGLPSSRVARRDTVPSSPLHEAAHVVAEPAVPLLPGVADEAADLIEAGRVPRFGDQLGAGQQRIRLDVPEHRRVRQRMARLVARQDRREIEAEAVDVHLGHPVAQAVLDQPAHDRLVGVQRVAAAGVVGVARLVRARGCSRSRWRGRDSRASGRSWPPSVVWLKTTSRMTSMPARWSALTMSRNSSSTRERRPCASCTRDAARRTRPAGSPSSSRRPPGASCGSNWKTGSSSTAVMPRSCR